MKGLELCRRFFESYGIPMIKEQFPHVADRIAAGLVGHGSDCLGFDDVISQDHDWGPGFCLWLTDEDYRESGAQLQQAYDRLPTSFMGYTRNRETMSARRTGVFSISSFYTDFIGLPDAPETYEQWMASPNSYLCACTSGDVFVDPPGIFSCIRKKLLQFYPEDVRLFKIAARCFLAAQSGQYNFNRALKRKEIFAASSAENRFCSEMISLVFLLNKTYMPFYKWRHRAVKDLGSLGKFVHQGIEDLVTCPDYDQKSAIIETLCARMVTQLKTRGLSHVESDFLLDHGVAVQQKINDTQLRHKDAWGG